MTLKGLALASYRALPAATIDWDLPVKPESISHRPRYARIEYEAGNALRIGGASYTLREIQVRAPSPVGVGGRHAPLELRFIAKDLQWNTVWVSVPVRAWRRNAAAGTLLGKLPPLAGHAAHLRMLTIDSMQLAPGARSEAFVADRDGERAWYVVESPVEWSQDQIRDFARTLGG